MVEMRVLSVAETTGSVQRTLSELLGVILHTNEKVYNDHEEKRITPAQRTHLYMCSYAS